jgi:large subunit ribosomal protein L25
MATLELTAQPRTILGKEVKKLRREGLVPAVVYGPGIEGVHPIALPAKELERAYMMLGKSAMLRLRIAGGVTRQVLIHEVQHDNTHRHQTHVDCLAPNMRVEMTVAVPVVLVGEAPAARDYDGIVVQSATELQVSALPDVIPGALPVDISHLGEIHAQVTAGDVVLPEGVTLVTHPEEVVITIAQAQLVEIEEAPEEVVEAAEEPASEEAPEGDEPAEESPSEA